MKKPEFTKALVTFINKSLLADKKGTKVTADTRLFEDGLINSMKIIDLIAYIEHTLKITIPDEKISMEYFGSVDTMVRSFTPIKIK